jgi:hypothetical protein
MVLYMMCDGVIWCVVMWCVCSDGVWCVALCVCSVSLASAHRRMCMVAMCRAPYPNKHHVKLDVSPHHVQTGRFTFSGSRRRTTDHTSHGAVDAEGEFAHPTIAPHKHRA